MRLAFRKMLGQVPFNHASNADARGAGVGLSVIASPPPVQPKTIPESMVKSFRVPVGDAHRTICSRTGNAENVPFHSTRHIQHSVPGIGMRNSLLRSRGQQIHRHRIVRTAQNQAKTRSGRTGSRTRDHHSDGRLSMSRSSLVLHRRRGQRLPVGGVEP